MSPKEDSAFPLPPPWFDFLKEIDQLLPHTVELHCLGGFVLAALYDSPRPTGDLDYIAVVPNEDAKVIETIAGRDSELARKHKLFLQLATIAEVPENYESRLREIFPRRFRNVSFLALDPHDLVLSKLTRNSPVDDADVQFLVNKGVLNSTVLRERYERELRPNLSNEARHDTTLQLWLEYFEEAPAEAE